MLPYVVFVFYVEFCSFLFVLFVSIACFQYYNCFWVDAFCITFEIVVVFKCILLVFGIVWFVFFYYVYTIILMRVCLFVCMYIGFAVRFCILLCSNERFESTARKQPQPEDDLQVHELQQGAREAASETHTCAVVVSKLF